MNILLKRIQLDPDVTIGRLSIEGDDWGCWVCEDTQRELSAPKVFGQTAIPQGSYRVIVTHSPHFNRELPLLVDVPEFDGVRIHPGNFAADTNGCLLPGLDRLEKGVGRSVAAFDALYPKIVRALSAGDDVFITIGD